MKDEWKVGRIIARPYVGNKKGEFKRTSNRHDYALKPYGRTALNALKDKGYDVISVGKIAGYFLMVRALLRLTSLKALSTAWSRPLK